MAYLTLFCRKFLKNSRKKSQPLGRGAGVKPVGPNSQLLPKICFASFPYRVGRRKFRWGQLIQFMNRASNTTQNGPTNVYLKMSDPQKILASSDRSNLALDEVSAFMSFFWTPPITHHLYLVMCIAQR